MPPDADADADPAPAAPVADKAGAAAAPADEAPPIADEHAEEDADELVPGHIPMASRLSLVSWGDGSAPSLPAIDDSGSEGVGGSGTADGYGDGDGGGDDADSTYDSDRASSILKSTTTSLRSSVYDYVEENGRTYHRYKEGKYPLPNDIQEQARLDLQHAIFLLMAHGKSYLAPIDKPKRVLDFATGTGIWAIEFGGPFLLLVLCFFFFSTFSPLTSGSPRVPRLAHYRHRPESHPARLVSSFFFFFGLVS